MLMDQVQTDFISLTPAAAQAIQSLLEKRSLSGYGLRVFISGGGCSGYQYGMALENNFRDADVVVEMHGVKVVVDEVSINYLRGANIDYIEDVMNSGFKIENPNAVASCGCGSSFRTKDSGETGAAGGGCSCH